MNKWSILLLLACGFLLFDRPLGLAPVTACAEDQYRELPRRLAPTAKGSATPPPPAAIRANRATQRGSSAPLTSPKPPWGEFPIIEEPGPRPVWQRILLWVPNRLLDLWDLFRIDVGVGGSLGVVARLTKWGQVGYRSVSPTSIRIGDFGRDWPAMIERSNEMGIGPFYLASKDREVCSFEIGAGADLFVVGAYAGICTNELWDFVGGIFLLDPNGDDL